MEHNWNGCPYHSLDWELKHTFGHKVYKLSLDAGLTCPNRDGTLGTRGCIFCSEGGSGILQKTCRPMYGIDRSCQKACKQ